MKSVLKYSFVLVLLIDLLPVLFSEHYPLWMMYCTNPIVLGLLVILNRTLLRSHIRSLNFRDWRIRWRGGLWRIKNAEIFKYIVVGVGLMVVTMLMDYSAAMLILIGLNLIYMFSFISMEKYQDQHTSDKWSF
jgi:hypothetical protein